MKRISSKKIKKIVFGILISDGHIDKNGRFDLYNKNEEYILFVKEVFENITNTRCKIYKKYDKRFNVFGYRLATNCTPYFKKLREIFYDEQGKKHLTKYIVSRIDFEALSHIWMCDGFLRHTPNHKKQKIQNLGFFCLESFPLEELKLLQNKLLSLGIESRFEVVPWGFKYRLKISAIPLQKFIDGIFQYIIPCFKYKTILYYKSMLYVDSNLQSAEQFIIFYDDIEDIVRHFQQ
jgi:hypothetical protein